MINPLLVTKLTAYAHTYASTHNGISKSNIHHCYIACFTILKYSKIYTATYVHVHNSNILIDMTKNNTTTIACIEHSEASELAITITIVLFWYKQILKLKRIIIFKVHTSAYW